LAILAALSALMTIVQRWKGFDRGGKLTAICFIVVFTIDLWSMIKWLRRENGYELADIYYDKYLLLMLFALLVAR
jgi:hypothetical protein